jgi:hypothetical protein
MRGLLVGYRTRAARLRLTVAVVMLLVSTSAAHAT